MPEFKMGRDLVPAPSLFRGGCRRAYLPCLIGEPMLRTIRFVSSANPFDGRRPRSPGQPEQCTALTARDITGAFRIGWSG